MVLNQIKGRKSITSKQKRQQLTNNTQPAIVVKDLSVPARDGKIIRSKEHSALNRTGWIEGENSLNTLMKNTVVYFSIYHGKLK